MNRSYWVWFHHGLVWETKSDRESAAKVQPRETRVYLDPRGAGEGDGPYREYVSIKGVKVNKEIDASIGQGGHAVGMVLGGIDVVDPNRVRPEVSHQRCIASALL